MRYCIRRHDNRREISAVVRGLLQASNQTSRNTELVFVVEQFLDPGKPLRPVIAAVTHDNRLRAEEYRALQINEGDTVLVSPRKARVFLETTDDPAVMI